MCASNSITTLLWIALCTVLFAAQHSLLASVDCKLWTQRHWRWSAMQHRRVYGLLAVVTTGLWWWACHLPAGHLLYQVQGAAALPFWILRLMALYVFWCTLRVVDGRAFLGWREAQASPDHFHERGIYRRIRHPMYTAAMLWLFAAPVQSTVGLDVALAVSAYLVWGARREEDAMQRAFSAYADYRARVPAFLPRWW